MNNTLSPLFQQLLTEQPKIELNDDMAKRLSGGLKTLGYLINDNFFDLPRITDTIRLKTEGLFYSIVPLDEDQMWMSNNRIPLIAIIKQDKRNNGYSMDTPLLIEYQLFEKSKYNDNPELSLSVNYQMGERTHRFTLARINFEGMYSHFDVDNFNYTLSDLLSVIGKPDTDVEKYLVLMNKTIHTPEHIINNDK